MNRDEALKVDRSFYIEMDDDTEMWCVFGDNSGFAYSAHMSEGAAQQWLSEHYSESFQVLRM